VLSGYFYYFYFFFLLSIFIIYFFFFFCMDHWSVKRRNKTLFGKSTGSWIMAAENDMYLRVACCSENSQTGSRSAVTAHRGMHGAVSDI